MFGSSRIAAGTVAIAPLMGLDASPRQPPLHQAGGTCMARESRPAVGKPSMTTDCGSPPIHGRLKAVASHMSRGPLHAKGIPGVAHGWATIRTRWPWRVFRERIGIPLACSEPPTGCRGGWRILNRLSRTSSPGARDRSDRPRSGTSCGVSLSVHFARSPSCAERDTHAAGRCAMRWEPATKSPANFQRGLLFLIPAFAETTGVSSPCSPRASAPAPA